VKDVPGLPDLPDLAGDVHGVVILISGARQVGKTTVLRRVRESALQLGRCVGGFLSVARFDPDTHTKTGIDLMDAATGDVIPLATIRGDGPVQTGHYTFNPAALDAGLRYARVGQGADVFFVDELGPLELKQGQGWTGVIDMLRTRKFGVALVTMRPELLELARERMALPHDTPFITINAANRDLVAAELSAYIERSTAR
jgi:nucleoside-triphosphatase THEP1